MLEIPSREVFVTLTKAINEVAPATIRGLTSVLDDGRLSVVYELAEGFGRYFLAVDDVPELLRPVAGNPRHAPVSITVVEDGTLKWHLQLAGVQRLLSLPVPDYDPSTCLWLGYVDPAPPTETQLRAFQQI